MSPGWTGRHPSSSRVSALDAGWLTARTVPRKPKSPAGREAAGQAQVAADDGSEVADRHALVGDRVQHRSRRGLLCRQADQGRGVQYVHRGPAAGPVADVAADALVAGDADQAGDQAVEVAFAVHRAGHPHDRRADAACRHAESRLGVRASARRGPEGRGRVTLGRHAPRHCGRPRRDDQGLAGALERGAHRLDSTPVGLYRGFQLGGVVDEREVDDRVGAGSPGAQGVQVAQVAAEHLGAHGGDGSGRGI